MARILPKQKTYLAKPEELEKKWYVIDAQGKTLGRLATKIATILMGKHKPTFTPHVDTGDYVIVVNAEKIVLTGKKLDQKKYYRHSGYPGGLKVVTARQLLQKHPEKLLHLAVKRMLPKNTLGRKMLKKLKVYTGPEHPHQAQKPEKLEI
ncbi:MAG: 50S ribosomal protein L13 [Thermotogaceae bacterium]|nr:50S ribosomal protein L13 [Thermotogaceae bacterium]